MLGVTAIQFTQDQARALIGVSPETIRHWRKAVPYLSAKAGKAARYSFPELLGLAITNELVKTLGVHIAVVSNGVDALFHLLARSNASSLQEGVAIVTAHQAFLHKEVVLGEQSALIVPLRPLVMRIQQSMLPALVDNGQPALPFPPKIIRSQS